MIVEFYLVIADDFQLVATQVDETEATLQHNEALLQQSAKRYGGKIERVDHDEWCSCDRCIRALESSMK